MRVQGGTMLASGTQFIYQNARHLERAIFEATFHDGSTQRITAILRSYQNDDGGWPIAWEAPSPAAVLEWRAQRTVSALRTLRAYGRI